MGATSVTGVTGAGVAGKPVDPISNISHVLFASPANDDETIASDINVVFLKLDEDNFTLNLPDATKHIGKSIFFRSRTGGYTATLEGIYGSGYTFSSAYTNFTVISDGEVWTITQWYADD